MDGSFPCPAEGENRERAGNSLSVNKSRAVHLGAPSPRPSPARGEGGVLRQAQDEGGRTARAAKARFMRERHEHYVEEPWVSRRLFEARDLGPVVVDPCAGFGHIVASARACGLSAYGSDLVKRAAGIAGGRDFLSPDWRPPRRAGAAFAIVCNPPFGGRSPLIRRFAEAAIERADVVALLVPGPRVSTADWLETTPLVEVLHVRPRTSLWPGRIYAAKVAGGEKLGAGFDSVCWLIFRRGARAARRTGWLVGRDA